MKNWKKICSLPFLVVVFEVGGGSCFFFNYSIINLQYCITFTCTAKWLGYTYICIYGFPGGSVGKESACNTGDLGSIPGSGRSLKKEMATHSSILACRIPWTEEPGGLQSIGSQRVGHNWGTSTHTCMYVSMLNIVPSGSSFQFEVICLLKKILTLKVMKWCLLFNIAEL